MICTYQNGADQNGTLMDMPMHSPEGLRGLVIQPMKMTGALLLVLTMFPYLQLWPLPSYMQPWPLLVGSLIFFIRLGGVWVLKLQEQIALLLLALVGIVLYLFTCFPYNNLQEYKYILIYLTPLVLTVAMFHVLKAYPTMTLGFLHGAVVVWFVVSVMQVLYDPTFATFTLGQWGKYAADIARSGRGALGLAPEPTTHAFHILVLGASMVLLDTHSRRGWLVWLCIVEAVVLAASSSAALVLLVALAGWGLIRRPVWTFITLAAVAFGWHWIMEALGFVLGTGSRMYGLAVEATAHPANLMSIDSSVNTRLGGLWVTIVDVWEHGFSPRGLSVRDWWNARQDILVSNPWLHDLSSTGAPSGIGILLFQSGFLVLPSIFLIFRSILKFQGVTSTGQVVLLSTPLIFMSQYYISAPSFALLYACAIYRISLTGSHERQFQAMECASSR